KRLSIHCNGVAFLKINRRELRFVRRIFGEHRERVEIAAIFSLARVKPRVFENACLVGDVQEITVRRERFLRAGLNWNSSPLTVLDHLLPAWKGLAEAFVAPRGNHLQSGRKR